MKTFNENFYTEDYDREMLDFIDINYTTDKVNSWYVKTSLIHRHGKFFVSQYDGSDRGLSELTKDEFKRKIGMPTEETIMENETVQEQATFGKKDLVDGMFVKCRNEEIHIVIGTCAQNNHGWLDLEDEFTEDLLENSDITDLDIVEVFVKEKNLPLVKHFVGAGLKSIWKRTPPKSEKVIKLEKLISMHEEQLEATKKLLEEELDNV